MTLVGYTARRFEVSAGCSAVPATEDLGTLFSDKELAVCQRLIGDLAEPLTSRLELTRRLDRRLQGALNNALILACCINGAVAANNADLPQ